MKIIVLAGGLGQRLWPLSRAVTPKQVQPFYGQHTLLQDTIGRLDRQFSRRDILVVTGWEYLSVVRKQLPNFPRKNILVEPARRNTAAAIGLGAYHVARQHPQETLVSIASDHFVQGEREFLRNLKTMDRIIKRNPQAVCLMGITPTYPETGYGYIELGKRTNLLPHTRIFKVKRFVEKPPLKAAEKMLRAGNFLWNPSYFGWRADRVQALYRQFIPRTHALLLKAVNGDSVAFRRITSQAIEYAVMEKIKDNFFVIPARFVWADVGHWASVREIQAAHSRQNVTLGLTHLMDTTSSLVYNYTDGVVTTIGVSDLLIVQTEDGTLVCHKDRAQDVRALVQRLQQDRRLKKFT